MNLSASYQAVRAKSETICAPLQVEDYVPQPEVFASPAKWHLAHTTWFFEEMVLSKYAKAYKRYHPHFAFLFNSYYNSVGTRTNRAHRGAITRPSVEEVYAYRAYVDEHMVSFLSDALNDEVQDLVVLGLNHEEQHQELLFMDIKYLLGLNPTFPVYQESVNLVDSKPEEEGWLHVEGGVYPIGFEVGSGFCFDNELGRHEVLVHPFKISKGLVTNGDFLAFVQAGGYEDALLWLDEGWSWVQAERIGHPLYWHDVDGAWFQYTLAGLVPLDLDAVLCHVSFYEANAFAAWKGMRLPTEFEWEVASEELQWGQRWEWTNSAYLPYPNFKLAEGAVGEYNGKFMVNQMVLRGGSSATSEGHSRKTYRNFFHPNMRWQFSGIRLVK